MILSYSYRKGLSQYAVIREVAGVLNPVIRSSLDQMCDEVFRDSVMRTVGDLDWIRRDAIRRSRDEVT